MVELVGGAFLSAVLQALSDKIVSPEVLNFFHKNHSIDKLLNILNILLWSANSLLNDAEDKQVKDVNIKSWVDKLNEVFHEADNVIDEINTEALQREINEEFDCFPISKKILAKVTPKKSFDDKIMKEKLETVIDLLKLLLEQKDYLGLKEGVPSKRLDRSYAPLIGDPCDVYGRDYDKGVIVNSVLRENVDGGNDKISVIPIVGMGGIGKTTLARFVYDDNSVRKHFEHKCAWVTVSNDFDVRKLGKLIFKELTNEDSKLEDLGSLKEELKKKLDGKKFLLVLDDIWNENYRNWDALKSFLEIGTPGIKIIMTTRNEDSAKMMGGGVEYHRLQTMLDDDCWKLFHKHVFHTNDPNAELEGIGREIVKKCKGLPLAVMSVAGLLCSVSNPNEWEDVLDSDIWDLQKRENDEILPSLWLSYTYLPSELKRCFSYCSIFPKDYEYEENQIIFLWMAEGLIQGENKEEIGEKYIKILVSRSLFQRSARNETTFMMHDLVHDLATFAFGKDFCLRLDEGSALNKITNKTRHLLLYGLSSEDSKNFKKYLPKAKCLRTFLLEKTESYYYRFDVSFKKFECLRVLRLPQSTKKLPNSIGNLKHLSYLDLSDTGIQELPNAVCTLYNLQTLLLNRCRSLAQLPRNINKLVNLRHLVISGTPSLKKMPRGICKLKSLQTLTKFVLSGEQSGCKIYELGELPNLRGKLMILKLKNVVNVEDVSKAEFHKKAFITDLILKWSRKNRIEDAQEKDRKVLDALQPHANLKLFAIIGYGGKHFSNWVGDLSFSNITNVMLFNCKHCCQLPPLGQLPSLKTLRIEWFDSIETISSEFYGFSNSEKVDYVPFKSLETLHIVDMEAWQSWSLNGEDEFEVKAFACLKKLHLEGCPKLKSSLPHCFPSLKELNLNRCEEMETLIPSGQTMNTAFPSLNSMNIWDCERLKFAGILPFPSSLNVLYLRDCNQKILEQRMQWGLKALRELTIEGCGDVELGDSFPEEELIPSTLRRMTIWNAPNLKGLNGRVFQQLTSLTYLEIRGCPELRCFPEEGLPASLLQLRVAKCPKIIERLKKEDWHKISHIPYIDIDGTLLQEDEWVTDSDYEIA